MIGMLWSSSGLGGLAKHRHIADCARGYALDFGAITELDKRDFQHVIETTFHVAMIIYGIFYPRPGGLVEFFIGIHSTSLELLPTSEGEYCIKFHLWNKSDNIHWRPVAVYGAAHEAFKFSFLWLLTVWIYESLLCLAVSSPVLVTCRFPLTNNLTACLWQPTGNINLLLLRYECSKELWPFGSCSIANRFSSKPLQVLITHSSNLNWVGLLGRDSMTWLRKSARGNPGAIHVFNDGIKELAPCNDSFMVGKTHGRYLQKEKK